MLNRLLILLFILHFTAGCNKEELILNQIEQPTEESAFLLFRFEAKHNSRQLLEDVDLEIQNNQVFGRIPYLSTNKSLIATFSVKDNAKVTINGIVQESGITVNDFSQSLTYTVTSSDGVIHNYIVKLITFTGLPIIYINTENRTSIVSKDEYLKGVMKIDANSQFAGANYEGEIEIRGRGNSTWTLPKKPYKIKLKDKASLLGMPADREWALLANYTDKTLLRNTIAFELSRRFGLAYTPRSRFVEVILNGEYVGNYQLTETIKISPDRVNITEMKAGDTSGEALTGGYLLEIDFRLDDGFWFRTDRSVPFTIESPGNPSSLQFDYIANYIQQTENALFDGAFSDLDKGYANFINTDSFINWFLVNELLQNHDAMFTSSVFLYKNRNDKLSMGPAWDFDLSLGNFDFYGKNYPPEGWWVRNASWIQRLFQDPAFEGKVKERWNALKGNEINSIYAFINNQASYLQYSQIENFKKWDALYNYTWPNAEIMGSYQNEVQNTKEWLAKRVAWMDAELNK